MPARAMVGSNIVNAVRHRIKMVGRRNNRPGVRGFVMKAPTDDNFKAAYHNSTWQVGIDVKRAYECELPRWEIAPARCHLRSAKSTGPLQSEEGLLMQR
jgi:hypothetical protein